MICLFVCFDRNQERAHHPPCTCSQSVGRVHGGCWYLDKLLPQDIVDQTFHASTEYKSPKSQPHSEVTGVSHQMSPEPASTVFVKLSIMSRVCCTDEVPTWFCFENFNTPTGTWHLNSSWCSRTSILPFAQRPRGDSLT